jgi:hypothetical protein
MLEVLNSGLIETEEQIHDLVRSQVQIVVPNDDDVDITHWWKIREMESRRCTWGRLERSRSA